MLVLTPEYIKAQNLRDDATYTRFVQQVAVVFGHDALANALHVSRPTVARWVNGVTLPHEAMREPLRRFALSMVKGVE